MRQSARVFGSVLCVFVFSISAAVCAQTRADRSAPTSSDASAMRPRVTTGKTTSADKKANAASPPQTPQANNAASKSSSGSNAVPKPSPTPFAPPSIKTIPTPNGVAPSAINSINGNAMPPANGVSTISPVAPSPFVPLLPAKPLPANTIHARISEAQRLLATRPMPVVATVTPTPLPTPMPVSSTLANGGAAIESAQPNGVTTSAAQNGSIAINANPSATANTTANLSPIASPTTFLRPTYFVTLAAVDPEAKKTQIHLITLSKDIFLTRGANVTVPTSLGTIVRVQILRANGVNTAVVISDLQGHQLTPLVVQYPIEKGGGFREMAYYTSAHPALLSPELVNAGQNYVHTMLDFASKQLRSKGIFIAPQVVDIAERLCIVEHIDHDRFRHEDRRSLFQEVYSLYALNDQNTFRYSVSVAGAGGMVQMIPSTYQMLRRLHPNVGLNPDFVAGMRNHGNALEAMLLYMQDTWNTLTLNDEINAALASGLATQAELLAAGYNSNPAHLARALRRGFDWRNYVPRETQMYLQIYSSLESLMTFNSHAITAAPSESAAKTQ